ncbi:MAG: TIGR01777 family oxidoreductase [Proteobacteria bacterium]|nr:TIGR01777 family oxidoreductase [Pseudomonadota bacterium]
MKALITGGTGFVGSCLTGRLLDLGWDVTITGRSSKSSYAGRKGFSQIVCDTTIKGDWQTRVADMDVVINLAGKNIFTRWNAGNKLEIKESRFLTTINLVEAMSKGNVRVFLSTSASGFYGDRKDDILTEKSSKGDGFLSDVCMVWENQALKAEANGIRTVLMRFGMILGKEGGALKMMVTPFKLGLGGKLGAGDHWMSWMHIDDLVSAILLLIKHEGARGPINFCSPYAIRNNDFTRAMAHALGRPAFFTIPSWALKGVMGELADALLSSQRMVAGELNSLGHHFSYPEIDMALTHLLG